MVTERADSWHTGEYEHDHNDQGGHKWSWSKMMWHSYDVMWPCHLVSTDMSGTQLLQCCWKSSVPTPMEILAELCSDACCLYSSWSHCLSKLKLIFSELPSTKTKVSMGLFLVLSATFNTWPWLLSCWSVVSWDDGRQLSCDINCYTHQWFTDQSSNMSTINLSMINY